MTLALSSKSYITQKDQLLSAFFIHVLDDENVHLPEFRDGFHFISDNKVDAVDSVFRATKTSETRSKLERIYWLYTSRIIPCGIWGTIYKIWFFKLDLSEENVYWDYKCSLCSITCDGCRLEEVTTKMRNNANEFLIVKISELESDIGCVDKDPLEICRKKSKIEK